MIPSIRVTGIGLLAALCSLGIDQASKFWLLNVFDLAEHPVHVAPVLDLVLAWNRGVSYSLLWGEGDARRWTLVAGTLVATGLLAFWLLRARTALSALALGLLIGGALGNVVDRMLYGAVADFIFFHVGGFRWYVFNGADCAITIGVILLLLDLLKPVPAATAPKMP